LAVSSGPNQVHVETATLIDGFAAALTRLANESPMSHAAFFGAFESLAWIGSIRDRLRSEQLPIPPVVDGLYYARNVVLHQGADVLQWFIVPGTVLGEWVLGESALGSESTEHWVWPHRAELSAPQSRTGEKAYDSEVGGRDVLPVLWTAHNALSGAQPPGSAL
jgi:hypothetical protein